MSTFRSTRAGRPGRSGASAGHRPARPGDREVGPPGAVPGAVGGVSSPRPGPGRRWKPTPHPRRPTSNTSSSTARSDGKARDLARQHPLPEGRPHRRAARGPGRAGGVARRGRYRWSSSWSSPWAWSSATARRWSAAVTIAVSQAARAAGSVSSGGGRSHLSDDDAVSIAAASARRISTAGSGLRHRPLIVTLVRIRRARAPWVLWRPRVVTPGVTTRGHDEHGPRGGGEPNPIKSNIRATMGGC